MAAITAKEYLDKTKQTKEITLTSGTIFEIRKISIRKLFSSTGGVGIKGRGQILAEGHIPEIGEYTVSSEISDDKIKQGLDANAKVLCAGVVTPKISMNENEEGSLYWDDISDDDYVELVNEIIAYSTGKRQDLKPFREEQAPVTT